MKKVFLFIIVLFYTAMPIQAATQSTAADLLRDDIMHVDIGYLNYTKDIDDTMKNQIETLYSRFEALSMDDKMGLGVYTLDRLYLLMIRTFIQTGWGVNLSDSLNEKYGYQHTIPFNVYNFDTFSKNIYNFKIEENPIIQTDTNLVFDFTVLNENTNENISEFDAPILFEFCYPQYNLTNVTLDGRPIPYAQQASYIYIAADHPGRIEILFEKTPNYVTGWTIVNYHWVYLDEHGAPYEGWIACGDDWYFLGYNGILLLDSPVYYTSKSAYWDDGNLYFVDNDGKMIHDSWYDYNGKWIYLKSDGKMIKNQKNVLIKGKLYDFDENGEMIE